MNKTEYISMTLKELVTLDKEGKLVPYAGKFKHVWDYKDDDDYINAFKEAGFLGHAFLLNLTQEGLFLIVDGKHRISLLLELGKSFGVSELESYNNRKLDSVVFQNFSRDDLHKIYLQINSRLPLKTTEKRYELMIKENRDLLKKLLAHDFFKNCHYLGSSNDMAVWNYIEILLTFLRSDFINADKGMLPSSLERFAAKKITYEKDNADRSFSILSFMESVFKGKDYVCRAIDFCCMAIFDGFEREFFSGEDEFSENDIQTIYDEYVKMWGRLEPCIILNPLATENLDKIAMYISRIIDKVRNGEGGNLNYQ
jgi:hypothetical protein